MSPNHSMTLVTGCPGSGKSVGEAVEALCFPGGVAVLDPAKESTVKLILTHCAGRNVLYDRLSDNRYPLRYGLLIPSAHPDPARRYEENLLRAETFKEILLRKREQDSMAGTPLLDEWVSAALMLYLTQGTRKPVAILPYAFQPGTDEFKALCRDTTRPELRHKFQQLEKMTPKGLRSEVGSASRFVNAVFRSPAFLLRCEAGSDVTGHLQKGGMLLIEKGDEVDEDATRVIMCGVGTVIREFCKNRPKPYPPILETLDGCNTARLAGPREQRAAGELRKYGWVGRFVSQWLNYVGGADGFLANCRRKITYRAADPDHARKMAAVHEAGMPQSKKTVTYKDGEQAEKDEKRAERVERLTKQILNLRPGERVVTDENGTRTETVPMLENPYPPWPGLAERKLEETLCRIRSHPAYRASVEPASTPGSTTSPSPPTSPSGPDSSPSPADRWRRKRKKRTDGSSGSGNGSDPGSG